MKHVAKTHTAFFLMVAVMLFAVLAGLKMASAFAAPCAAPTCRPYFKSFGSDVSTGGALAGAGGSCTIDANYQYATGGNNYPGGILAFDKFGGSGEPQGGASSEYAAYSLGLIEGDTANSRGFYTQGKTATSSSNSNNALSFANYLASGAPSNFFGGLFQGTNGLAHCVPDYFNTKQQNPKDTNPNGGVNLQSLNSNSQYKVTDPTAPITIKGPGPGFTLGAGRKLTLFVDGDAYINTNIRYQVDKDTNAPKFAMVVKGSIYIDPAVTRLDGLYIAQPKDDGSGGAIWTCHGNDTSTQVSDTYAPFNCQNKLTVYGAFIAKQVNFLRVNGDTAGASGGEDSLGGSNGSGNLAEVINYSPIMSIGGPFFTSDTAQNSMTLDSLISLPPVF